MPTSAWEDVTEWEDVTPSAPMEGELLPRGGGPQSGRVFQTKAMKRDQVARDYAETLMYPGSAQESGDQQFISGVTGMAAQVPGLMTEAGARIGRLFGLTNANPQEMRNAIQEDFTYQPTSPGATEQMQQGPMAAVGRLLGPVAEMAGAEKRRFEGVPVLQDLYAAPFVAGEALLQTGGAGLLGRGAPAMKVEAAVPGAKLLRDTGVAPTRITPAKEVAAIRNAGSVAPQARAAGFEVTPSAVGGSRSVKPSGTAAALEGPARNPEASLRNAQQFGRRAGDEYGVKVDADARLDPAAFDEARLPAFGVYEEMKALPGGPSPEYSDAMVRAVQAIDVPAEAAPEVARLLQRHGQVGDSAQLVEDLKALRRTASKRREGDTANQVANEALADVDMAIADELENELGRRGAAAGDAGAQQRLRDARRHLAELHELERATRGGYVDVSQLAARQNKTGKLTGNLQLGAQMGENLPGVFQHPQSAAPASTGAGVGWKTRSVGAGVGGAAGAILGGGIGAGAGAAAGAALSGKIANLLSRMGMRKFNENIPFGANALDEFDISPVRDRGYPSPMGPNAGPVQPPPGPQAPPGMFADDIPPPSSPSMPSAGRPEPSAPGFNQLLAGRMAGDLQLEGALPPAPPARGPQGFPLDMLDFERGAPPAAPGRALPPLSQDQLRLAPEQPLGLEDARPNSLAAMLDEPVGFGARALGAGIDNGSFASQLGPISRSLDELLPEQRGIPARPRGVTGPRSAQLTDPGLPEGFELIDETPLPRSMFGPEDEFAVNNASGQTGASLEAMSALGQQPPRFRVNVETGEHIPLPGLEARDPRAFPGEMIVEEGPQGFVVIDRGGVPQAQLEGVLARLRTAQLLGR